MRLGCKTTCIIITCVSLLHYMQVISKLGIEEVKFKRERESVCVCVCVCVCAGQSLFSLLQEPDLSLSTKKEQAELLQEVS